MTWLAGLVGLLLAVSVLWDAFETILLPRRIPTEYRLSRGVLSGLWWAWRLIGGVISKRSARENFLSTYAILGLLSLLMVWALGLIVAFALLHWGIGLRLSGPDDPVDVLTALYMSGSSFFTLGLGDVHPTTFGARVLTVVEAGTGFGFLALVIAYLPVLYQAFSRREVRVTMLDQWAGSPPSAPVVLRRSFEDNEPDRIEALLHDWEVIASELLESHISYPLLAFFRSQHDNQSWLAGLTTVLDTCALVLVGVPGMKPFQARLTFAIARHAAVDLCQTFHIRPRQADDSRLTPETQRQMRAWLREAGVPLREGAEADAKLAQLRAMYEPYVLALSDLLLMPLPGWLPPGRLRFNWETTTWAKTVRDEAH